MARNLFSALALFAFLAGVAAAADPVPVRAKAVIGSKVTVRGGTGIGVVDDIVLSNEGMVEYLIVNDGGKMVTAPWEAARFDNEKRTAFIDVTPEVYRKVPTYTVERYPTYFAPTYRTEVYKAWGLRPGPVRRIDRRP